MAAAEMSLRVQVETQNLRDRTTVALREAILGLHFKPGEKLVERRLCEETGVSRTCVREALRHLEAEGLVVRAANKGMFVATLGEEEARQIYEVRELLEAGMARHFVERAEANDLTRLTAAAEAIAETIFGQDTRAYVAALDAFTDALMAGGDNEVARDLHKRLRARITVLRNLTSRAMREEEKHDSLAAVRRIVAALEARDKAEAEESCRAYVRRSARVALALLRRQAELAA